MSHDGDPLVAQVRETLARHAADIDVPASDPWPRFAASAPPPRPRRPVVAIGVAVLAFACALVALVIVGMRSRPTSRGLEVTGRPPETPSSLSVPPPPPLLPNTTIGTAPAGPPPDGPLPAGFRPASVTFDSLDHGWVLGTAPCAVPPCTSIVRTTDGGKTWHGIPAPSAELDGPTTQGLSGLRFADDLNGWAFGSEVWLTHDGGASWTKSSLSEHAKRVVSLETASGAVYALTVPPGALAGGLQLWRADMRGDAWQPQAGSEGLNFGTDADVVLQGSAAWVVVRGPDVVYASTDGTSWHILPLVCPIGGLAAAGPLDVTIVCAGDAAAGSQQKPVYVSHDGGQTFSPVTAAPFGGIFNGIAQADPSTIVVGAASGSSFLYGSFDGGHTWSTVLNDTTSGGAGWHDLGFTSPTRGVVVEGNPAVGGSPAVLYRTDDGGRTWSPVTFRS